MILADWIAIAVVAAFILIGALVGFGKGLKFFTSGIFGIIISILVCYLIGGMVLEIPFVQELLEKFINALAGKNKFCNFLLKIHIEIVVYYLVLFIIVSAARVLIVFLLKRFVEIDRPVFKLINKLLGILFFLIVLVLLTFLVFQIIYWIGGSAYTGFKQHLAGSFFKLDKLLDANPLASLPDWFKQNFVHEVS
ncbi:MAG: hypothetical protein K2H30_01730 [Clostridia bacterium]|nr:hypothetical protein [Clostridia bacterium]MDE7265226.1 hypothetical protein [Clostridia bacterium]